MRLLLNIQICFFSLATILALFLGSENLIACHEEASGGDGGMWPTLRGHSPTSRQSGILVTFEGTSASISTTTNCDAYTHFIELNYDQIANNAVALGTQTTGNYMAQVSGGDGITISHTQSEGSTATITGTAIYNASGTKLN